MAPRLGRRRDDLRRLDLDESGRVERLAHPCERQRAEPEHRAAAGVAQGDGRVVELERQLFLQLGNPEVDRRRLRGRGDQGERRVDELDAARCLLVELGGALDGEDRLVEPLRDLGACRIVVDDDLAHAFAVAEDDEVDSRQGPVVQQPTLQLDAFADVFLEFGGPDSHRGNATARPLNRCDARTG